MESTHFLASSSRWCISEGQCKIYHNLWLSLFNENKNKYFSLGWIWLVHSLILNITTQSIFLCEVVAKIGVLIKCNKAQVQLKNKFFPSSNNDFLLLTMTWFNHNMEMLSAMIHLKNAFKHSSI